MKKERSIDIVVKGSPSSDPPPRPYKPAELSADAQLDVEVDKLSLAYLIVIKDPRYVRFANKFFPDLFSSQMVKNVGTKLS